MGGGVEISAIAIGAAELIPDSAKVLSGALSQLQKAIGAAMCVIVDR